jgi:hypothetical protein
MALWRPLVFGGDTGVTDRRASTDRCAERCSTPTRLENLGAVITISFYQSDRLAQFCDSSVSLTNFAEFHSAPARVAPESNSIRSGVLQLKNNANAKRKD